MSNIEDLNGSQAVAQQVKEKIEEQITIAKGIKDELDTADAACESIAEYLEGLANDMAGHGLPMFNEAAGNEMAENLAAEIAAGGNDIEEFITRLEGILENLDTLITQHDSIRNRNS